MMKNIAYCAAAVIFALICTNACQDGTTLKNLDKDVAALGQLQCAAQDLRVKRFQLADDMRFSDDSLKNLGKPISPERQRYFDSLKTLLTAETALMSKRITGFLDSLWNNGYAEEAQRQKLDAAIINWMQQNCPEKH